jgi:hypothetical protein
MSGKFNNRLLLWIFLGLAAIFVVTRLTRVRKSERTLRTELAEIDTSQVSSLLLYPRAEQGKELEFKRNEGSWTVSGQGTTVPANRELVKSILAELKDLEIEQLVARSPDSWDAYQLNDSLGTRVVVREGNKTTLDLVVGRFHYQQAPGGYSMYGQNRGTGKTYIRLSGEDEVYLADGFLAMSVNQRFNRWRDQTITRLNTGSVSKIICDYPADSGFIAERTGNGWLVGGLPADSAAMASYLGGVSRKTHSEFADGEHPSAAPDFSISFEGDNMPAQSVSAYLQTDSTLVLTSSINPGTWFRVSRDGLFEDLFPGASGLLPGRK